MQLDELDDIEDEIDEEEERLFEEYRFVCVQYPDKIALVYFHFIDMQSLLRDVEKNN